MKNLIFCFCISFYCIGNLSAQSDSIILALEDTLRVQTDSLGKYNTDVMKTRQKLGKHHKEMRNYDEASKQYEQVLIIQEKIEEDSLKIAQTHYDLSVNYYYLRKYEGARIQISKSLTIRQNALGKYNPDVVKSYSLLSWIYISSYKFTKALEVYEENVLKIQIDSLGNNHLDVANSYNNIAIIYFRLSNYTKSTELLEKAIKIYELQKEKNNAGIAMCYNNMALDYAKLGDYIIALELYKKALNLYDDKSEDRRLLALLANTYHNMSEVYSKLGNYSKSLNLNEDALKIRQKLFGENHHYVGASYNALGFVYYYLGDYKDNGS